MNEKNSNNKAKGDLAEDLVAQLHKLPGVNVKVRTRLPRLASKIGATREVDVLLEGNFAGFPARVVFEVKNEEKKTGTEHIDSFHQKLMDVGVHAGAGVFVSAAGYTAPALEKTQQLGIRTYLLEGLTEDRLGIAVNKALQSLIYVVATWRDMNIFPFVPDSNDPGDQFIQVDMPAGTPDGRSAILNTIWRLWIEGGIPPRIGEHIVLIRAPKGWSASVQEPRQTDVIIVTVEVTSHVASLSGTVGNVALTPAGGDTPEKISKTYEFPEPDGLTLETFRTEAELNRHFEDQDHPDRVVTRIRVPRIVDQACFWPPTQDALATMKELVANGQMPTFGDIEGNNLHRAWMADPPIED